MESLVYTLSNGRINHSAKLVNDDTGIWNENDWAGVIHRACNCHTIDDSGKVLGEWNKPHLVAKVRNETFESQCNHHRFDVWVFCEETTRAARARKFLDSLDSSEIYSPYFVSKNLNKI
ncbi:hypothetical protein ACJBU6_07424 [Exserohilum turcicum]